MRKVVLYMALSLDGFVASEDGSVDWIDTEVDLGEGPHTYESFLERVDAILMGRNSYDQSLTFGPWPYGKHQTLVFTHRPFEPQTENTQVVTELTPEFVRDLKQQEGKDLWLFGGGGLNHFFMEHDLIDELMLFVQPTVLGKGISLFGNRALSPKQFRRKQVMELGSGFTLLWMEAFKSTA